MQGFAIGNGDTDPYIQYNAYTDFALENNLINGDDYKRINKGGPSMFAINTGLWYYYLVLTSPI